VRHPRGNPSGGEKRGVFYRKRRQIEKNITPIAGERKPYYYLKKKSKENRSEGGSALIKGGWKGLALRSGHPNAKEGGGKGGCNVMGKGLRQPMEAGGEIPSTFKVSSRGDQIGGSAKKEGSSLY